jgi:hypothetical protein
MSELLELAERVEALAGDLRPLNREVALAVGWCRQTPSEARRKHPAWFHPDDCRDGKVVMDSLHGTDVWREPLNYLGSLDAAMSLLPKSDAATAVFWKVGNDGEGGDPALFKATILVAHVFTSKAFSSVADTAPLAIVSASLRARAAIEGDR